MVLPSPGPLLTPPFFLPPEDLFPVLLLHNSTPLWEPDPAPARRPRQQQAGTGCTRVMGGQNGPQADTDVLRHPRHSLDCVEAVR